MSAWEYSARAWSDEWRRGSWLITRHPRRAGGYYIVWHRGERVTMRDCLTLAQRFVERQGA